MGGRPFFVASRIEYPALLAVLLLVFTAPASASDTLPLPERTNIPDDFSTVICPSVDAARAMWNNYYRVAPPPRNHTHIIPLFFEGLEATGCFQDSRDDTGTIEIEQVLARRELPIANQLSSIIVYTGRDRENAPVIGIVDEAWNNRHPRTPLERWLEQHAEGDMLQAQSDEHGGATRICPTVTAARAAISAIPDWETNTEEAATAALEAALTEQGCRLATGRFRVTALHEESSIPCGMECAYVWTALEAEDSDGRTVGLAYDGSLM